MFGDAGWHWYNSCSSDIVRFVQGGVVKTFRCTATSMDKANYAAGLNEFSYCATLHVSHPTVDPEEITTNLQIEPSRMSRVGQDHRSIPDRVYEFSHWSCKLPAKDGDDIPTFLGQLVTQLSRHRDYLHQISDGGGEIECFIGIFPERLCDQLYPHELLATLADLRINLRLDFYGENSNTPSA